MRTPGFFMEAPKNIPVRRQCDVLVAGGGVAGIAAALAAARTGARVTLVEKQCALGGLATLGLITIYLPLCDGEGRQVIHGIGEELLRLSIRHGWEGRYPAPWLENGTLEERKKTRFQVQYNPWLFALLAEEVLLSEGVEILFDAQVVDLHQQAGLPIEAVTVQDREGRWGIAVGSVIDATGDAALLTMAGEKTAEYPENRFAAWHYLEGRDGLRLHMHATPLYGPLPDRERFYDGTKTADTNALIQDGHRSLLSHLLTQREKTGDHSLMPASIPLVPSLRMTRRLQGRYTLDEGDVGRTFDDSIGMTGDWRKPGPVFELPFGTLYGIVPNLLTAGRSISVTTAMWDITRVIPTCAVTGEAAGTAAALLVKGNHASFQDLPVSALQEKLRSAGVRIHLNELEPKA